MYLINDVLSNGKHKVYGRKGDHVKIVSVSDPVAIVEDEKGERFPTLESNLSEETIDSAQELEPIIIKNLPEKKTKSKISTQPKLF